MKKIHIILIVVFAIILIAGALTYFFFFKPKPVSQQDLSAWQTYRNSTYGISVKYPADYIFYNGQGQSFVMDEFFVGIGKPLFTIELPENSYPGTNYYGAFFMLSVGQEEGSAANCNKSQRSGTTDIVDLTGTQNINGINFFLGEADGATTEASVQTKIYHTVSNNICYEATLTIVSGNLDNNLQSTAKKFNEEDAWNKLKDVLGTISFNNIYNN